MSDDCEDEAMNEDNFDDKIQWKSPLSWAIQNNLIDIVRLFLNREDLQPDLPDSEGQTIYFLACNSGNEEVVELLSEQHIALDPNLGAPLHIFSPLTVAAFHAHESVIKLLQIYKDIDPNTRNHNSLTVLSIAASKAREGIVKPLLT